MGPRPYGKEPELVFQSLLEELDHPKKCSGINSEVLSQVAQDIQLQERRKVPLAGAKV